MRRPATNSSRELEHSLEETKSLREQVAYQKRKIHELSETEQASKSKVKTLQAENSKLHRAVDKLTGRLNSQTEEYQQKNKSIELMNDEFLSLQIENNLLFQRNQQLQQENEQLLQRWMDKMQKDADLLNERNEASR